MRSATQRARVGHAMRRVQRSLFLPAAQQLRSDEDTALPIGCGQTASQPSLVAFMTEELHLTVDSRVLEIGTGCGYQTAILAELAREVFTVERIRELAVPAEARLRRLGYRNLHFRIADGSDGWPEESPFDAVIVTAAPTVVPIRLVDQLRAGGRMVVPVGSVDADDQRLVLVKKGHHGNVVQCDLGAVRFVPLVAERPPASKPV